MFKRLTLLTIALAMLAIGGVRLATPATTEALGSCQFFQSGTEWQLLADCSATQAISVPNGITLNGKKHTIFADDWEGAVVYANGGGHVGVKNLKIIMSVQLDDHSSSSSCGFMDAPSPAIINGGGPVAVAIHLAGTSGMIINNDIVILNSESSCEELTIDLPATSSGYYGGSVGILIEKEGASFLVPPTIGANRIIGYSRAGIWADGPGANVNVFANILTGDPSHIDRTLTQAGVYVTGGSQASVVGNIIFEPDFQILVEGDDFYLTGATAGVYVDDSDGANVKGNMIFLATFGVLWIGSSNGQITGNTIVGAEVGVLVLGSDVVETIGTLSAASEVGYGRADDNSVAGNLIIGGLLGALHDDDPVITANGATSNFYAAVWIRGEPESTADGNLVIGNIIGGCYEDSVENDGTNTTVFANTILGSCLAVPLP